MLKRVLSFLSVVSITLVIGGSIGLTQEEENQSLSLTENSATLNSRLNFDWNLQMGGFEYSEAQDQSQLVFLQLRPQLSYKLLKDLTLNSTTNFFLTTGRAQSRFYNPNFSTINLLDLSVTYKPDELIALSAGALNQKSYDNRMFIADRAFPGLKLESGIKLNKISSHINFQYSIPTSASLESDRTQAEKLPTLSTVGLKVDTTPISWFNYKANMNYFKFQNLPSIVAFQSGTLGNEVIGTDPSESSFAYQFEGYTMAHNFELSYTKKFKQVFEVSIVDNSKAPQDRRRSQWIGTGILMDFKEVSLNPKVASFYAESDSVPAIYSAFELGRNNREGMNYGFRIDFKNQGFAISTHYIETNLIQLKALQRDMNYLEINLEVYSGIL